MQTRGLPGFTMERQWRHAAPLQTAAAGPKIRVLQYNILAEALAEGSNGNVDEFESVARLRQPHSAGRHFYRTPLHDCYKFRADQESLAWVRRRPLILAEIRRHAPDIICLQEVDNFQDLKTELALDGFSGLFGKNKGYKTRHGNAVFWRTLDFRFKEHKLVHLGENIMTALLVKMTSKDGTPLVVCSTHLKAGMSGQMEELRVRQVDKLLSYIKTFARKDAVVLGADLNAHHANYSLCSGTLTQPLALFEVTAEVVPRLETAGFTNAYGDYPSFTSWAGWLDRDVKLCLDYIMLQGPVSAMSALDVPPDDLVADHPNRMPNDKCPSDHVCLVADVQMLLPAVEAAAPTPSTPTAAGKGFAVE